MMTRIEGYQIIRRLQQARESQVYEALERRGKRTVVIKVLSGLAAQGQTWRQRLTTLVAEIGRLGDAGLAAPLHYGSINDRDVFLVTPFISGEPLAQRLGKGPLPDALRLSMLLSMTLTAADSRGFCHQRLAPDKIILTPVSRGEERSEQPVVLEIGVSQALRRPLELSRLTKERRQYLAPEQRSVPASPVDGQADVYALAVLLFQMLGGEEPHPSSQDALWRRLAPAGTGLTSSRLAAVCRLLSLMLAADAAQRPRMPEVAARLQQLVAAESLPGQDDEVETVRFGKGIAAEIEQARARATQTCGEQPAAEKAPPVDPLVGQLFGKYRLRRPIGAGGMGTVYEAEDEQIGYRAAVKVLHQDLARDPEYAKRFLNEARAVNIIRDPGLVTIFAFDQREDGSLYIVMEYLSGETLLDRIHRTQKPIAESLAREIALQVARALSIAHDKGVVHRDLKPANLMLIGDPVRPGLDRVKILDFGIAKLHEPKITSPTHGPTPSKHRRAGLGTPGYMAPEQIGNSDVDGQADVFALGVVLYEALTAQSLFRMSALELLVSKPAALSARNPAVSAEFANLVERMLSADAKVRPTMSDLVAALEQPVTDAPAAMSRHQPKALAGLAGLLLGVTCALFWFLWPSADPSPTPEQLAALRTKALGHLLAGLREKLPKHRNEAVTALGGTRDVVYREDIERLLQDPDSEVRAAAATSLGQLGASEAGPALLKFLETSSADAAYFAAAEALLRLGVPRGREILRTAATGVVESQRLPAALRLLEHYDELGKPAVQAMIDSPRLSLEQRVRFLSALAQVGDALARQRLVALLGQPLSAWERIRVATSLAMIGEERGRRVLAEAARRASPQHLLAAVSLASFGECSEFEQFRTVATDRRQPLDFRLLAIRGLTEYGLYKGALVMAALLDDAGEPLSLRIAAADGIVRIIGSDANRTAVQSLQMAQAMLGSPEQRLRIAAVNVLGELDGEQPLALLGVALKDSNSGVRIAATQALSRKRIRATLSKLRIALDDADSDVRTAGLQAVGAILGHLEKQGDKDPVAELRNRLLELVQSEDVASRIVASAVLLRSGDARQLGILRDGLRAASPLIRKLVIEVSLPDSELVQAALEDEDFLVRFAAARRLAEAGSRAGIEVLRAALAKGGADGLLAYGLLLQLKEKVAPPAGLAEVLTQRGDLAARLAVLDILFDLPEDEALKLLRIARVDSAWEVRSKVIAVATEYYHRSHRARWLDFIRGLVNDQELAVRARAVSTLLLLTDSVLLPSPPAAAAAPGPRTPPATAGGSAVSSPSKPPAQSPALATRPARPVPKDGPEQLLADAAALISHGQFRRAQPLLDRVRAQRGALRPNQRADLAFQQARWYEAQGLSQQAADAYREFLNSPGASRRAEQTRAANQALERMNSKMGTLMIFEEHNGTCKTSAMHLAPGEYQAPGSGQKVRLRSGITTSVGACR